ncbi:Abi-alpha family protein [Nocardioides sp. CCNWLW239]|uniref:Abi-alpha family protein n=1 Tax=Nocardioides sp. CCNWLW239 TaxID=3128902 RepID=UPI0030159C35
MSALHINTEPTARRPETYAAPSIEPQEQLVEGREGMHRLPTPAPSGGLIDETLDVLPGLLRISAVTVAHTAGWGLKTYVRGVGRVAKAVVDPNEAVRLTEDVAASAREVTGVAKRVARGNPITGLLERYALPATENAKAAMEGRAARVNGVAPGAGPDRLRRSGEELLRRSRDVWDENERHPAFVSILDELAPDEARILVLMLKDGPQPAVDVVEGGLIGHLRGSRMIARGLTMIGAQASVRYPSLVPQYLNNLTRLGLVWQSEEPVTDLIRYQVVEAQPDVLEARHAKSGARIKRRSIHLTPFGQDFARACFADAEDLPRLPSHEIPPSAATESPTE